MGGLHAILIEAGFTSTWPEIVARSQFSEFFTLVSPHPAGVEGGYLQVGTFPTDGASVLFLDRSVRLP
jgi:hypothetical protein